MAEHGHMFSQPLRAISWALLQPPAFSEILALLFHFDHVCHGWPFAEILLIGHGQMLLSTFPLVFVVGAI